MILWGLVLLCPLPPSSYCCVFSFDGGGKGMVLRRVVLLCPLTPFRYHAGSSSKFTKNPAMKKHLLSTGTSGLAEAIPFDAVSGICLRAGDPEGQDPFLWRWKHLLGKTFFAVRDALHASEAGLAHPAFPHQFGTPTTSDRIHEISQAPPRPLAVVHACLSPPFDVSTWFFRRARKSQPRGFCCRP